MDRNNALLLALLVLKKRQIQNAEENRMKIRVHKVWVRKILTERTWKGEYHVLVNELKLFDHEFFYKQFRMSPTRLEELLCLVGPLLVKSSLRREVITPGERLCITLRSLCSGDSNITVACSYRVGISTVGKIIKETCIALWKVLLSNNYIKAPSSTEEWLSIAHGFESLWNFHNCIGAIDGKHIVIQAPPRAGSSYFNYKKTHSIVLMAICDYSYRFILVDIGDSGRESDGSVFAASSIGRALSRDLLNVPKPRQIPGSDKKFPYVIVGDEAFPLKTYLLKPYARNVLDDSKRIFNYRLSRARRVIENAFGIMASRFRIFHKPINSAPENVKNIVKAAVALHNFLLNDKGYLSRGLVDSDNRPGDWREQTDGYRGLINMSLKASNNYTKDAKSVRDNFKDFFNSNAGEVSWQSDYIHRTLDYFDKKFLDRP